MIYLSPPYASKEEKKALLHAADSGWIAPVGPQLNRWEKELSDWTGRHVVLLNSGTAAIHLALILAGVKRDDTVLVASHTCNASVNPILYLGAKPHFIDSEPETWNMDPELLEDTIRELRESDTHIAAIIGVDIYGTPAYWNRLRELGEKWSIPLIQDSAEAMGGTFGHQPVGVQAEFGVWSFNGNKIISTSGGGALICDTEEQAERARKLATQAKERTYYYWHTQVGYTYRMSNLLAGFGHAQWENLSSRVDVRVQHFERYQSFFRSIGVQAEYSANPNAESNRWLSAFYLPEVDVQRLIEFLAHRDIEARRFWKPMHHQPIYQGFEASLNGCSDRLFDHGVCLPCGAGNTDEQIEEVLDALDAYFTASS